MDPETRKTAILRAARDAGFVRARILAPGAGAGVAGAPALLVIALPYGDFPPESPPGTAGGDAQDGAGSSGMVEIAPFARRNYYREAIKRLQRLGAEFRRTLGERGTESGARRSYRIFCNSPIPEKPLAEACGLGAPGRNGLIITAEAGSRVILAAMTLPFELVGDGPLSADPFPLCGDCPPPPNAAPSGAAPSNRPPDSGMPPCAAACPTGAVRGDGTLDLERCIQWYASGGDIRRGGEGVVTGSYIPTGRYMETSGRHPSGAMQDTGSAAAAPPSNLPTGRYTKTPGNLPSGAALDAGSAEAATGSYIPTGRYTKTPGRHPSGAVQDTGSAAPPSNLPTGRYTKTPGNLPSGAALDAGSAEATTLSYIPTGRYTKPPPIPADIASAWGRRLYGCTRCQDACPHNKKPLPGVSTEEGPLPAHLDGRELLTLDDAALKARFRGSALGMTWLTPDILRRSITTALAGEIHPKNAQP